MVIRAKKLITGWKSFTILINTRLNFVLLIYQLLRESIKSVSMEISVLLLTLNARYQLSRLTSLVKIQISTCSILSPFGALITRRTTKETNVYIHTIGKILEENLSFTTIKKTNVRIGAQDHLSTTTKMDVLMSICALIAMVGKNKNIILKTISSILASMESIAKSLIVLTITINKTGDNHYLNGLKYFLRQEKLTSLLIITCLILETKLKIEISWEVLSKLLSQEQQPIFLSNLLSLKPSSPLKVKLLTMIMGKLHQVNSNPRTSILMLLNLCQGNSKLSFSTTLYRIDPASINLNQITFNLSIRMTHCKICKSEALHHLSCIRPNIISRSILFINRTIYIRHCLNNSNMFNTLKTSTLATLHHSMNNIQE